MILELLMGVFGNQFAKNYLLPPSFRPSVRTYAYPTAWIQHDGNRKNFLEISRFEILLNFVNEFRFAFKSLDENRILDSNTYACRRDLSL
jgi:hypothetical protein